MQHPPNNTLSELGGDQSTDLLHIDIRGAGADNLAGTANNMQRLVKRVLIGTHSQILEGRLMTHFNNRGWRLEIKRADVMAHKGADTVFRIDGVQMWASPALEAA